MAKEKKKEFDYSAELKKLKTLGPERVYLLSGEEDYLREQFIAEIRKLCLGGEEDFNYRRLDGTALDMNVLAEAVDAVPFLAERTVVEVRDFDINHCRDKDAEQLKKLLSDVPDTCTLLFVIHPDYEMDGRLSAVRIVKQYACSVDFAAQGGGVLFNWINRRFAAQGKKISRQDMEYLIFVGGTLMNQLIPEIEKLCAGTSGDTVTRADIDALVRRLPDAQVFDMLDDLSMGKKDAAAAALAQLLAMSEEPSKLLSMVGMQVRRLFAVKLAQLENCGRNETLELVGVRYDFIVDKLRQSAKRYSFPQIGKMLDLCAEYDYKMKRVPVDKTELLKELFMRIAEGVTC